RKQLRDRKVWRHAVAGSDEFVRKDLLKENATPCTDNCLLQRSPGDAHTGGEVLQRRIHKIGITRIGLSWQHRIEMGRRKVVDGGHFAVGFRRHADEFIAHTGVHGQAGLEGDVFLKIKTGQALPPAANVIRTRPDEMRRSGGVRYEGAYAVKVELSRPVEI